MDTWEPRCIRGHEPDQVPEEWFFPMDRVETGRLLLVHPDQFQGNNPKLILLDLGENRTDISRPVGVGLDNAESFLLQLIFSSKPLNWPCRPGDWSLTGLSGTAVLVAAHTRNHAG